LSGAGANAGASFERAGGGGAVGAGAVTAASSGRLLAAVRREDSCAGNKATRLVAMIKPAVTAIVLRLMTYPARIKNLRRALAGIGAGDLAGLIEFMACGDL
jgi:hypothetical protein